MCTLNGHTHDAKLSKRLLFELPAATSVHLFSRKLEFLLPLAICPIIPILHLQLPVFIHRSSPQL